MASRSLVKSSRVEGALLFGVLLALVIIAFAVGSLASPFAACAAGDPSVDFDKSYILDGLAGCSIDGKPFSLSDYPADNSQEGIRTLLILENGYSPEASNREGFGLYLYLYNPSRRKIDVSSPLNSAQFATRLSNDGIPSDYMKFRLQFLGRSTDPQAIGVFLKYKVVDAKGPNGKYLKDSFSPSLRVYACSGVELLDSGADSATEHAVGQIAKYSGFQKGLGYDPEVSDLSCVSDYLETVVLKVSHVFYRTGVSDKGKDHQHMVDSVFFSVPDRLLEQYGSLQKVLAEWFRARSSWMFITDNDKVRGEVYANRRMHLTGFDDKQISWYDDVKLMPGGVPDEYEYYYNFTSAGGLQGARYKIYGAMPYALASDSSGSVQGSEAIRYALGYGSGGEAMVSVGGRALSSYLFDEVDGSKTIRNIDVDTDVFDLEAYDSNHGFWNRWADFGFLAAVRNSAVLKDDYKDVAPISKVSSDVKDDGAARRYLVDASCLPALREEFDRAEKSGETVFLLRFGVSDYHCMGVHVLANNSGIRNLTYNDLQGNHYVAKRDMYFDFDIISLTFKKADVLTEIPAVSSPIHAGGDAAPPVEVEPDPAGEVLKSIDAKVSEWLGSLGGKVKEAFRLIGEKFKEFFAGIWSNKRVRIAIISILSLLAFLVLLPLFRLVFGLFGSIARAARRHSSSRKGKGGGAS